MSNCTVLEVLVAEPAVLPTSAQSTSWALALPAEAAATIFQIVSQRCLKTSIVLTGNRRVGAHQVGNFDVRPWEFQ